MDNAESVSARLYALVQACNTLSRDLHIVVSLKRGVWSRGFLPVLIVYNIATDITESVLWHSTVKCHTLSRQ